MANKICSLLFVGFITVSAASNFNCSIKVSTNNTCDDELKEIKCNGTETDNSTVILSINDILVSSAISNICEIHIEFPKLQISAEILFPNVTIKKLVISKSDLTDLPELALSNLNELQILILEKNSFTNIPGEGLHYLSALEILTLSYNNIQHVKEGDLKNLSALLSLSLAHNIISLIDDNSFSSLISLTSLNLENNSLSYLQKDMFTGLKKLNTLIVAHNKLINLPEDLFTHLKNLKAFEVNGNKLASLRNVKVVSSSLESLSLENSNIKGPFESGILEGLPNLTKLFLSNNPIGNILSYTFSHMHNLTTLKLDFCELVTLDKTAFHNLTRLSHLDLSNNKLQEFTCSHTLYLESLKTINLESNELKTIEKGTFYYSNSLENVYLEENELLCDCQLADFVKLLQNRSVPLDDAECINGDISNIKFDEMNCVDNADICTKAKDLPETNSTISNPQFTIKFISLDPQEDSLQVKYIINKIGNFPVASDFSCEIANIDLIVDDITSIKLECDLNSEQEQSINIESIEEGKYNICISIFYHKDLNSIVCKVIEHEFPNEVTENESTYILPETSKITTHSTTVSLSTVEDVSSLATSSETLTLTHNASITSSMFKTTTEPTTHDQTTHSTKMTAALSTTYLTETPTLTSTVQQYTSPTLTSTVQQYTSPTLTSTVQQYTSPTLTSTVQQYTSPTLTSTVQQYTSPTLTSTVQQYTSPTLTSTVQQYTSPTLTSTVQQYTSPALTSTMQQHTWTTVITSPNVTNPSPKVPSVKSFSIHKDAKAQLWLTWNMTLEHSETFCVLEFSVHLYNEPQRNWEMQCKNGSYFLGDIKATHPYQICIKMYWQKNLTETNCTEISPSFVLLPPSSKDRRLSAKLSIAALIALIILAVIILILIIIILFKILYLKRNKTNTYNVAKEETNNQSQITKRDSNLYSVSSIEDDQV